MPDSFEEQEAFWRVPLPKLQTLLEAGPEGLSDYEADKRLRSFGANVLRPARRAAIFRLFFSRFRNPLVMILLTASAISAVTGELTGFIIIWTIVLMSVTLDFVQEHRAGRAAERLKRTVALRATILREGGEDRDHGRQDCSRGRGPAQGGRSRPGGRPRARGEGLLRQPSTSHRRAVSGREGCPRVRGGRDRDERGLERRVHGNHGHQWNGAGAHLPDRRRRLSEGSAKARRPSARDRIRAGHAELRHAHPPLDRLLVLFVLLVNALFHRPWLESFLFAVALAVGLTPELLPMVVSITLSRGALRMAQERVDREAAGGGSRPGSMDILCTDKTGTLTEGQIRLERHVDPTGGRARGCSSWPTSTAISRPG